LLDMGKTPQSQSLDDLAAAEHSTPAHTLDHPAAHILACAPRVLGKLETVASLGVQQVAYAVTG
jgi:hypothetical protein